MTPERSAAQDVVYGALNGNLVFIPKERADYLAAIHAALWSSSTWREVHDRMPAGAYEELLEISGATELPGFEAYYEDERRSRPDLTRDEARTEYLALSTDERRPEPDDPFEAGDIGAICDGDWPGWTEQEMLAWVPKAAVSGRPAGAAVVHLVGPSAGAAGVGRASALQLRPRRRPRPCRDRAASWRSRHHRRAGKAGRDQPVHEPRRARPLSDRRQDHPPQRRLFPRPERGLASALVPGRGRHPGGGRPHQGRRARPPPRWASPMFPCTRDQAHGASPTRSSASSRR